MARPHTIKNHPDRLAIEAALAARVPLRLIAERHHVSKDAASRWRVHLRAERRLYFAALKKALAERPETLRNLKESYVTA